MSRHHPKKPKNTGNPLQSWLSICILGFMAIGLLASMWTSSHLQELQEQDLRKWRSWPATPGSPSATRTYVETKGAGRTFFMRSYVGECRVEYTVTGKEYSLWIEALRSREPIADQMRSCPVPSYDVHYDPIQPSIAHAFVKYR